MCLSKTRLARIEMPGSYSVMETGDSLPPVHQQQQIAEIFSILASLTRDMDSVKHTLEQLLGDGQPYSRYRSGQSSRGTEESGQSYDTGLESDNGDRSATLPGLLLSPRMLDPVSSRHSPEQSVCLNIGGVKFDTTWGVLERLPKTRLGRLALCKGTQQALKLADRYDPLLAEYYFDRRPRYFADILGLYQTGKLHMNVEGCKMAFMEEMVYWDIDEMLMESCCHQRYLIEREIVELGEEELEEVQTENFLPGKLGQIQKKTWDLFEHPASSQGAKFVAMFSVFCIFLSTVILTLDSLPYFQDIETIGQTYRPFVIIEASYMAWFTIEFFMRFISSPSKLAFVKKAMNIIDLLAILPYYISLAFYSTLVMLPDGEEEEGGEERKNLTNEAEIRRIGHFLKLFRIVKMFRIIRIFKLARHSGALKALGKTMTNCYRELGMLFLFLFMGVLIFSTIVYVFESDDPNSSFITMLDAYWWALITMTTVGYGEVVPITGFGRLVGAICATFGVLVIALPIPIIGNQFGRYYQREQRLARLHERLGAATPTYRPIFTTGVAVSKFTSKVGQVGNDESTKYHNYK